MEKKAIVLYMYKNSKEKWIHSTYKMTIITKENLASNKLMYDVKRILQEKFNNPAISVYEIVFLLLRLFYTKLQK